MTRKRQVLIWITLSLSGGIIALIYGRLETHKLKTMAVKYICDTIRIGQNKRSANSIVFFIRNLDYKKQLLELCERSFGAQVLDTY